jgi:hypothetical protein
MENKSWLRENVRPLIALIIIVTISLVVLLEINTEETVFKPYMKWGAGLILFYYGSRQYSKFVSRKKKS